MCPGKCPLGTEHDVVLGLVIGHADQHDLAVGGHFFRHLRHLRSPSSQRLRLLPGTIIDSHLVTGVEQPPGHMTAHVPHTDKAKARFQMVAFHIHCNTFLSSEMLSYAPPRHPPENLLSYKGEVRGRVWSLSSLPRPPQPTWTSLERIQQLEVYWEDRGKSASIRCHVTSHPPLGAGGSRGRKGAHA